MIRRVALTAALLQFGAFAQLELLQYDKTTHTETPVTASTLAAPSVAAGDTGATEFHIKNLGNAAAQALIDVKGTGFTLDMHNLNPCTIAPGQECVFDAVFSPTAVGVQYSAVLTVNNLGANTITVILTGSALPSAAISVAPGALSGNALDFGPVEVGTKGSVVFTLANPYAVPLTVGGIQLSGSAAFTIPQPLATPLQLQPNDRASFEVDFAPQQSGVARTSLTIDHRTFQLTGTGTIPALPKGTITVSSQAGSSGQQLTVSVPLAASSKSSGTGTLTMTFQPATGLPDDPAIQFLSGPKRSAAVSIAPGDASAKINGQDSLTFQTGTTAGTIAFDLKLPNSTDHYTIPIAPAMANLSTATGVRRIDAVDVNLAGFDNTHSISQLSFTFYDAAGHVLQPGVIRVDATPEFKRYFDQNVAGGAFTMLATFTVTGGTSTIATVDVQVSNAAGIASPPRITLGN